MDIAKELEALASKKLQIANQINMLAQQQAMLTQELFRIEGEERVLQRLSNNGAKEAQP